jgi:hypothetical protein
LFIYYKYEKLDRAYTFKRKKVTTVPRNSITTKRYITMPSGTVIPVPELSKQDREAHFNRLMNRLGTEFSLYYTQNPEAYINLCKLQKAENN